MKFVVANWGSRGDIEPCVALGRELMVRGHEVCMAVSPNSIGFAKSVGLTEVRPYGPELQPVLDAHRDFWTTFFRSPWRLWRMAGLMRKLAMPIAESRRISSGTLTALADGADLIIAGTNFEDVAANVAEHYGMLFAALHFAPVRSSRQLLSSLPAPIGRFLVTAYWWLAWRLARPADNAQRRELGLPESTTSWPRRIAERGSLEIQAYERVCFPDLGVESQKTNDERPVVGQLTLELPTETDGEIVSWIAAGTPPIYFGFGSVRIGSPSDTLAMISAACEELGERALIGAAGSEFDGIAHPDYIKVVGNMNHSAIFPTCRAVVHHGGAGTTAAVLRAGVPQLILWTLPDQILWGARIKRLGVGFGRRLSTATPGTLVADLRSMLDPGRVARAREVASQVKKPSESVAEAADLVEQFVRSAPPRSLPSRGGDA